MKKQTIGIIMGILVLSFASAMYAGECEQVQLDFESYDNITYSTVGNQFDLEGLNIVLNGTIANICPAVNYKPDNFTIIFMENSITEVEKEVIVYRSGGTKTKTIYENITKYIPVEKIVQINNTIKEECPEVIVKPEEEKTGFFNKVWNWIKNLFRKNN